MTLEAEGLSSLRGWSRRPHDAGVRGGGLIICATEAKSLQGKSCGRGRTMRFATLAFPEGPLDPSAKKKTIFRPKRSMRRLRDAPHLALGRLPVSPSPSLPALCHRRPDSVPTRLHHRENGPPPVSKDLTTTPRSRVDPRDLQPRVRTSYRGEREGTRRRPEESCFPQEGGAPRPLATVPKRGSRPAGTRRTEEVRLLRPSSGRVDRRPRPVTNGLRK